MDSPERTSLKFHDLDDPKTDRRAEFRDKFFKDRDYGDRDKDFDRRDGKHHLTNGRKIGRDDREDWSGGKPRRTFGQDDNDRGVKRSGDFDRWGSRDFKDNRDTQELGGERTHRDREQGRFPNRRDPQARGRHDHQPWFRDGETQDPAEPDEQKPPARSRDWRRGGQGQDHRDWNRPIRHEQDPEWMDSSSKPEPRESHTQEDFQRWKERMKTGAAHTPVESKKEAVVEVPAEEPKPAEAKRADGEMFSSFDPSLKLGDGLDNFFGIWGEPKPNQEATPLVSENRKEVQQPSSKPAKSSRFAGFFNAPNEPAPREPEPVQPQPSRPVSTDADQEGFQRILQMLGGNKSRNATPQAEEMGNMRSTPPQQTPIDFNKVPTSTASPLRDTFNRQEYMRFPEPHERAPPGLEHLLAQKTPKETATTNRDAEFLLRLMQQSKISSPHAVQPSGPQVPVLQNPGGQNIPDMQLRMQEMQMQKQKNPAFFDDPAIANMQRPEPADSRSHLRRRPTAGPSGYFDEMPFQGMSSGNHTPTGVSGVRSQAAGQPPVLQRPPPGLEQVGSPWSNPQLQQQQQQQAPNPLMARAGPGSGPGPGPANPPNRTMNPNFHPGPPISMPAGMPPPNDRQAFQRGGAGAAGASGFGPPPGILPPPGYMNMNVPPPSVFPPMPHTPDAVMGMPHGHPSHFPAGPQQGVSGGPSSRQLLDMFTGHGGGGPMDGNMPGRNAPGMMGPGPFR